MKRMTREWVRKAELDWRGSERLAGASEPFHDLVAFHCQQCAEKLLKALLEESGASIPKTHDLENLLNLTLPLHPSLQHFRRAFRYLSGFAVNPRYPLFTTNKRQAAAAIRWAQRIRLECRTLLGLKTK